MEGLPELGKLMLGCQGTFNNAWLVQHSQQTPRGELFPGQSSSCCELITALMVNDEGEG